MQLNEASNMVKALCNIPAIEDKLRQRGYSEQEIPELVKQIVPLASAALEDMKKLMERWDSLKPSSK